MNGLRPGRAAQRLALERRRAEAAAYEVAEEVGEVCHRVSGEVSHVAQEVALACTTPPEPRWPAAIALLSVGGLYMALPSSLTSPFLPHLPRWLLFAIVAVLLIPTVVTFRAGNHRLNHLFGFLVLGVVTVAELWSLGLLIWALPRHLEAPGVLLRSAAALWITNVIVFALWYWRLDAGGPHERDRLPGHTDGAFLFPQMAMDSIMREDMGEALWAPHFVDYLFLSFNHSTALSPTDVAVLSRWAKILTMIQAGISLATVALLAARAVNIL